MEEWLARKHRSNPFYLLRGTLAYGAPSFNCIFALAGSGESSCNGLWKIWEEALEALAGHKRGQGKFFDVYNNLEILAKATAYIQQYGVMLNLAIASYTSAQGFFLILRTYIST